MKTTAPPRILIAPIGDVDPQLPAAVGREIRRVFRALPEVRPLLSDLSFAFDAGREQYHSTPVLQRLAEASPPEALRVLALTDVDLFIPILTHVYGEAQLGGKACILSTYRFTQDLALVARTETFHGRLVKEAVHELGHTFGRPHAEFCGAGGGDFGTAFTGRDTDHQTADPGIELGERSPEPIALRGDCREDLFDHVERGMRRRAGERPAPPATP